MTLLQHWDELEAGWPSQKGLQWPNVVTSEANQQPRQCIGKIRDALAHGLFVFEEGDAGKIAALHLWTCRDRETVDWHAVISVDDMERMLNCFVELARRKNLAFPIVKRKGDRWP